MLFHLAHRLLIASAHAVRAEPTGTTNRPSITPAEAMADDNVVTETDMPKKVVIVPIAGLKTAAVKVPTKERAE